MAGTVKGITIEFRGDTTQLSKAINQIRQESKGLDKELGYVDKALKFDPGNTTLIQQKMQLLRKASDETGENIKDLKNALEQLKENGVDETSAEYRELQREIAIAEGKQKSYNKQLKELEKVPSRLEMTSQKFAEFGNKATQAGEALKGLSMVAGGVDLALAGLAVKSAQSADDLNTLSKVTGISTAELQKYKASADLLDVSVDTIAKSQTKLKKSMYSAQQGSEGMATAFSTLGVSIEDSNGHLRSQDEVFADAIKALGQMENETERDAIAMQIFGKSASELNPLIEDNGETFKRVSDIFANNGLEIVDQETIDKANQFQDSLDTIKATGMATLSSLGMQLAGYLAPAMEKIADVIGKIMGWLSQLDPEILTIIGIIAGVVAGLAPVLIVVGKLATAIGSIMTLASTLGPILAGVGSTLLPIVGIIAGVVAVGVLLYKNWDTIKAKAIELKNNLLVIWNNIKTTISTTVDNIKNAVTNAFNNIKNTVSTIFNTIKTIATGAWNGIKFAITHPIDGAVTAVKFAIDKIKGFFSNLSLKLPHIKLPHFKISGKLSLTPPSVPKLSIDWYKNGGIFTSPTVFNGVGVGEAGAEAVLPLKKLWEEMDKRFSGQQITINVNAPQGMNVNELASEIERRLINAQKRRKEAWL